MGWQSRGRHLHFYLTREFEMKILVVFIALVATTHTKPNLLFTPYHPPSTILRNILPPAPLYILPSVPAQENADGGRLTKVGKSAECVNNLNEAVPCAHHTAEEFPTPNKQDTGYRRGGCCTIGVWVTKASGVTDKAYAEHKYVYTGASSSGQRYKIERANTNGKTSYTLDGWFNDYAIWWSGDAWIIGDAADRGSTRGYMRNHGDTKCPSELGYDWEYHLPNHGWLDAGKSLTVSCAYIPH